MKTLLYENRGKLKSISVITLYIMVVEATDIGHTDITKPRLR